MINLKSKRFWFAVIAFALAPVVLNFTVFGYRSNYTNGSGDQWFSFFGNYTGGLISAFVAYVIANSQIQKQLKLDLAKEKYHKTINQLPALVRIKLEMEKYIRELTRVKEQREATIVREGGIRKKLEEHEKIKDFLDDFTGIMEHELTELHYEIEQADPDIYKFLEQVENVDLHVDLITTFNFYKEFAQALPFDNRDIDKKEQEIIKASMQRGEIPSDISEQISSIRKQSSDAYSRKKYGWKALYEEFTLKRFNEILTRLDKEISLIKRMKEEGDATLNDETN